MPKPIIVVEDPEDWRPGSEGYPVVHVDDYLTGRKYHQQRNLRVINLCRSYRYQSVGYYCSLLAEARGHRVLPSVKTTLDLSSKAMYGIHTSSLDELASKRLAKRRSGDTDDALELDVVFGRSPFEHLADFARHLFDTFPCPILRVGLRREGAGWHITTIRPMSVHRLEPDRRAFFDETLGGWLRTRWRPRKAGRQPRYDIAILHTPDPLGPSDETAIRRFVKAGKQLGVEVEVIGKKDYPRLAEYDALFIRDTTNVKHYTYRFSKRAESEGMVVIDDPTSILRCTNKVYLAELLRANHVPAPRTVIAGRDDLDAVERAISYPMILKVPDGSFSRGVVKATNSAEMRAHAESLFKATELILAQEYLPTAFDWRIGVLDNKPIYACQYFMSKNHWQIMQYKTDGSYEEGGVRALRVEDVPPEVVSVALSAAILIGDGLYGVDLKETRSGVRVIEVNDNPSIDAGFEDGVLKDDLYRIVIESLVRRLDQRHEMG